MRPLVLHYEKDETARECNTEFLVGENLLAAPVVVQGDRKKLVYLPAGEWYDYWTGERLESVDGKWIVRDAPLDTCPLYVKAGTVLPVWPKQNFVGEKDTDSVLMLEIYPGEGSWEHFQDDGESFDYRDGVYNQYHCELKDRTLTVTRVHDGYEKKYEKVLVTCMGQSVEGVFDEAGKCEVRI